MTGLSMLRSKAESAFFCVALREPGTAPAFLLFLITEVFKNIGKNKNVEGNYEKAHSTPARSSHDCHPFRL
jgi:hypothetical protein